MFTLVYVHLIESGIMAHKTEKLCIHVYSQVCFLTEKLLSSVQGKAANI